MDGVHIQGSEFLRKIVSLMVESSDRITMVKMQFRTLWGIFHSCLKYIDLYSIMEFQNCFVVAVCWPSRR